MTTPTNGYLFHFTHVENLESIITDGGLLCDSTVTENGSLAVEVGHPGIKERRRGVEVGCGPGGVVADYVPFYFAARSPMLYVIDQGRVSTYQRGQDEVAYVVTSVERVVEAGLPYVFTDRNAAVGYVDFYDDAALIDQIIDWDLMHTRYWSDTADQPDRKERRMAEFLVHGQVPWELVFGIAVRTETRALDLGARLTSLGCHTPVRYRPDWYY